MKRYLPAVIIGLVPLFAVAGEEGDVPAAAGAEAREAVPASPHQVEAVEEFGTFAELDTNSNGLISREEAKGNPFLQESWSAIDTNENNEISQREFDHYRKK